MHQPQLGSGEGFFHGNFPFLGNRSLGIKTYDLANWQVSKGIPLLNAPFHHIPAQLLFPLLLSVMESVFNGILVRAQGLQEVCGVGGTVQLSCIRRKLHAKIISFRILFLKSELPQPHLGFHAVIAKGDENLPFFLLDVDSQ